MPTLNELLDAAPDAFDSESSTAEAPQPKNRIASGKSLDQLLDEAPDAFHVQAVPETKQRGVIGEFTKAASEAFRSLVKSPQLLLMDDDQFYDELRKEARAQTKELPAEGIAGGAARIAGSIVGGVGEFAASTAMAGETGPAAPFIGPAVAFGATSAWESAVNAGIKALQEGKTKQEVIKIARDIAKVGAGTGAVTAAAFGATGLIPKTVSALARTAATSAIGTTAGVGGQLAENIAEKEAGLDVSPTEGLLEQAVVMGLLPVVAHAKDLYRQARLAKDPAIAKTIQKSADEVARQELAKADVTPVENDTPEIKQAKEAIQKFVTGAELKTPKGVHPEEVGSERMAKSLEAEIASDPVKPAILPKSDLANVSGSKFRPEVPETAHEEEKGISVIDEIKASGAKTIADIQRLFPQAQLNREAARKLRDQAWGKPEQPTAKPKPPEEPPAPAAEMVEKQPPKPPGKPTELSPEDLAATSTELGEMTDEEAGSATSPTAGETTTATPAEPATKTETVKPKEKNAIPEQKPSEEVFRDEGKRAGEGVGLPQVGARDTEPEKPAETQKPEAPAKQDVKLGQWPESEWSYSHLKSLPMTERANRARYLGLRDKEGLVEVSPKKIADRAKQRLDEIKATPKPVVTLEPQTLTPAIVTEAGQTLTGPNHAAIRSDAAKQGTDAITGSKEGFVNDKGEFVSRSDGAKWFEQKTGKKPATEGELHSEDLRDAGLLEHLPKESKETPSPAAEAKSEPEKRSAAPTGEGHTIEGARAEAEKGYEKFSIRKKSRDVNERLKQYGDDAETQSQNLIQQVLRPAFQKRTGDEAYSRANSIIAVRPEGALGSAFDRRGKEGFEKIFGKRVVFYRDTVRGGALEGYATAIDPDVIFVNADAETPWIRVAAHELFHQMANERPDLFKSIIHVVKDDLLANRDKLMERYGDDYKGGEIPEEVMADFAGEQITEPAFWKRFAEKEPHLFHKAAIAILDWLKDVGDLLRGGGYQATKFFKDVESARNVVVDALAQYTKEKGGQWESDQGRFSISKAPIEQYADALKGIKGEKRSLREQFGEAFDVGLRLSKAKDAFGKGLDGLKATGDFLIERFKGIERVDDLLRAKGLLSEALETRGRQVYKWVRAAKKAVPQGRYQAAIRKWVDAGGDMEKLKEGARETKPQFRRAYEDAQNLSPENLKIAQETRKYHEARLQEAIDAGVLEDGVTDYIHRMYERRPELGKKLAAFFQSGILKTNPALTKERVFTMDWQAEKEGFVPNQSFIDAVAEYESSLSRAIAARQFVARSNELMAPDGRPVVDIKGMGIPITDEEGKRSGTLIKPQFNPQKANVQGTPNYRADYVNREYSALSKWKWVSSDAGGKPIFVQGDVAIHPDFVQRFDALLEPSRVRYGKYGHIMRPALAVSSAFKQTMLDLSGFHQVQIAVHAAEHKVLPWNIAQDIDFQHPDTQLLLRSGMTIGGEYHYAKEGLIGSSLIRQVPVLGPIAESYHEWLFRDFIPRVKYTMARKALERNRERYAGKMSEEQIGLKTASQANDAFGGQNAVMLERSKTAQDMARLIMLAPDFLESRAKFAASALALGGKRFGNEQRTALLLGALTMYTAARVINQLDEGHPHFEPENMFSWVHNGQAYSLRTVQGDILHLLEKPLNFWMHRLNPVFGRTLLGAATQRDEFGRKRSPLEMLWDTASNVVPISLRTSRERSIWESMANAFGITDRRWQDTDDAFKLARKWKDEHGIGERGEFIYDPDKDPLRGLKVRLSRNDDAGAANEIKKLLDSKIYTMEKLDAYFRRYRDMAFTGSKTNDKKWQAELSEDQKKTVDAAKDHKQAIAKLYQKARGQYKQALANPL